MKNVIIINQKGGVGKSTITVNISYALAQLYNKKTLMIDLDPQGQSCNIYNSKNFEFSVKDIFLDRKFDIQKTIYHAYCDEMQIDNLDIISSDIRLAKIAEQISSRIHREKILYDHFKKLPYDYIISDCPPNLGVITINAIYCADIIIIPINYDKGALDGMADLLQTVEEVKENREYKFLIVLNEYDSRNKQTNLYIESQLVPFKEYMVKTKIRKSESINQARIVNQPIFIYAKTSYGCEDYINFIREILNV